METRANYIIVGSFTLLVLVGSVVAIIWMAGANLDEDYSYYDIYFEGSVTGLKPGNPVRYRGIPVGVISEMHIDPGNVERVRVTIEIPETTPIKSDTFASMEFQGITGIGYIQISGGTNKAPRLLKNPGERRPEIPAKASQLQELFDSTPELITRVTALVDRFNLLFSARNRENFSNTLKNIEIVSRAIADRSDEIDKILTNASGTMHELRNATVDARRTMAVLRGSIEKLMPQTTTLITNMNDFTVKAKELSGSLGKEIDGVGAETKIVLAEVRRVLKDFGKAAQTLSELVEANREPVDAFASSGLYELTQLLTEARILMGALTRIAAQIERDPARFLFGQTKPGVEVK